MASFIVTNSGQINVVVNGKMFVVAKDHLNYNKIKELLAYGKDDELLALLDVSKSIAHFMGGKVKVKDGAVYYNDQEIKNALSKRILDFMAEGLPCQPLILFLENLMENPSYRSVEELYDFLEHKGLPITEDGYFLAHKGIRSDWLDKYSGKILNTIGSVIEVPRNYVDDERENTCSFGLHCGTLSYVKTYCTEKVVIVKVNPKDCVSVPKDHDAQKLRVCKYEVISEYTGSLDDVPDPKLVNSKGETWEQQVFESIDPQDDLQECGLCLNKEICCCNYRKTNYYNTRGPDGRFIKK